MPPRTRNAPTSAHLDKLDATLDRHGAFAPAHERYHDPIGGLRLLVKRLKEDSTLLSSLADVVGSLESLAAEMETPGQQQARRLSPPRDVNAPATHSGQVRESPVEPRSRPE